MLTAVWLGDPLARVHRARLGASQDDDVRSPDWDPRAGTYSLRRARNESGALFSIYLENGGREAVDGLTVEVTDLVREGGNERLRCVPADLAGNLPAEPNARAAERGRRLHRWDGGRDLTVHYVRYLRVENLSLFGGYGYDGSNGPNAAPTRLKATRDGRGYQAWERRPDHDAEYPEVCVPAELHGPFAVAPGRLQELLVEGYVPKAQRPGVYVGRAVVKRRGVAVPGLARTVRLTVRPLTLPDALPAGTPGRWTLTTFLMGLYTRRAAGRGGGDGMPWDRLDEIQWGALRWAQRLGVSAWTSTGGTTLDQRRPGMLTGRAYARASGYRGPRADMTPGLHVDDYWWQGAGFPKNPIYDTKWRPNPEEAARIRAYADKLWQTVQAMRPPGEPPVEVWAYLIDEYNDGRAGTNAVAKVLKSCTGGGQHVKSFATVWYWVGILDDVPDLDLVVIPPIHRRVSDGDVPARMAAIRRTGRAVIIYNGGRPGTGTYHVETPCGDRLMKPWECRRGGYAGSWHFEATRCWDDQGFLGYAVYDNARGLESDIWSRAANFDVSGKMRQDGQVGRVHDVPGRNQDPGWSRTSNGDGLLMWPGTDWYAKNSVRRPNTHVDYDVGTAFPSKRLFDMGRSAMHARYLALADRVDRRAVDAVDRALIPGPVGLDIPPVPDGGNQGRLTMRDASWPEAQRHYEAAVDRLAAIIAGAPAAPRVVPMDAARHDGLAGAAVARGPVPFLPGEVQPADLARLTAWDADGREVPVYVEDVGARHAVADAPDDGVLYAYVEAERTWAAPDANPRLTVRFDRPVGPQSRRARAAWAQVENRLAVAVSPADPARFRVTNAGFYHHGLDDRARRFAPGDVGWGPPAPGAANEVPCPSAGVRKLAVVLGAGPDGALVAYAASDRPLGGPLGTADGGGPGPGDVPPETPPGVQTLAVLAVYLRAGPGVFTCGITPLTDPTVARVTVTGAAVGPYDALPRRTVAASLTAADGARRCASRFVPWELPPADAVAGAASEVGSEAPADAAELDAADRRYLRLGPDGVWAGEPGAAAATAAATYAANVREWQTYARTGQLRALRRALAAYAGWRDVAEANRLASADRREWTGGEAFADGCMAPFHFMLTGDPEAWARAEDVLRVAERAQYQLHADPAQPGNTLRWGMRVKQQLVMLHRLGRRDGAGVALAADGDAWRAAHATAVGTAARWRRAAAHLRRAMRPGAGPNAALRRWAAAAYGPPGAPGAGPYALGLDLSFAAACQDAISRVPTVDEDLRDTYRYLFEARRADGTGLLWRAGPGGVAGFVESEAAAARGDTAARPDRLGAHLLALAYLARQGDAPNAEAWRGRLAALAADDAGLFGPAAAAALGG